MPLVKPCIHLTEPRRKRRLASTRIQMRNIPKTAHAGRMQRRSGALLYRAPSPTTVPHRFRARAASERYLKDGKAGRTRRQNDRIKQSCPHSVPRYGKTIHFSYPCRLSSRSKLSSHPVVLFFYMGVLKDFCFMPVIISKYFGSAIRIRQPVPDTVRNPFPDVPPAGKFTQPAAGCLPCGRLFKGQGRRVFARPSGDT